MRVMKPSYPLFQNSEVPISGQGVIQALMEHGPQSLHDLRRSSGLATPHLKVALLVLIQHNYVACWLHRDPPNLRGEYRVEQLYEALPAAVLASLHAPRLLIHIKDRMGDAAEAVALRLLQNGRLRYALYSLRARAVPRRCSGMGVWNIFFRSNKSW